MFEPSSPMYAIANYFFTRKLKTRATVSPEGRFSFFVASTDTARLVSQSWKTREREREDLIRITLDKRIENVREDKRARSFRNDKEERVTSRKRIKT